MQRNNAGQAQTIGVLAVLLLICGAVAWLLLSPVDDSTGTGGEDPRVEAGGDPNAGTFEPGQERGGNGIDPGTAQRTEVDPGQTGGLQAVAVRSGGIRGSVVDGNGAPIQGATVVVSPRPEFGLFSPSDPKERDPEEIARMTDVTGADGRYFLPDLPGDEQLDMWVHHSGFGAEMGPPVIVLPGEVQEMPAIVLDAGYALTGVVVDTAGNPLPAQVELRLQEATFARAGTPETIRAEDLASGRLHEIETDGNGEFRAAHLAQGVWSAHASCEGFASNVVRPIVMIDGNDPEKVTVVLDTEHLLSGTVVTQNGDPVEGARIHVARVKPRPSLIGSAVSGADGAFTIYGLAEGSYGVVVQADGFTDQRMGRVDAGGDPVRIVMLNKAMIEGRVTGPNGLPVREFSVELMMPMRGRAQYRKLGFLYDFRDENGNFKIDDVNPGTYVLLARAAGYAPTYSAAFQTAREELQGIDIVMSAGGLITGRVVDVSNGEGIANAEISLRMSGYKPSEGDTMFGDALQDLGNVPSTKVRTDVDGRFRIADAYVERMALVAEKEGYLPITTEITPSAGNELSVGNLEMRAGGTLTGTAVDGDGKALAGGSVSLTRPGDVFQRQATLDARGRFSFGSLRTGQYEIVAFPPSDPNIFLFPSEAGKKQVYVEEGKSVTIELQASRE